VPVKTHKNNGPKTPTKNIRNQRLTIAAEKLFYTHSLLRVHQSIISVTRNF